MGKGDCGYGYSGYAYRMCENGVLGEIHMDKCVYEAPLVIHYEESGFELVVGIESRIEKPKYENMVTKWRLIGGMELPMGLMLDELSGEISGIPLVESEKRLYRIMRENRDGGGWVDIEIMVRKGVCRGEGLYVEVEEGGVVIEDCSGNGLYIGRRRRDVCWVRRMEDSRVCVRVSVMIVLVVIGMIMSTMVTLMKRRKGNELRVCEYVEI